MLDKEVLVELKLMITENNRISRVLKNRERRLKQIENRAKILDRHIAKVQVELARIKVLCDLKE